ncbi:efflux MFS transporter permease [Chitinophaga ginsengisoli]|uniref:DHA2 family multidrug resistance protein n=1 Tax=Chitinophaga ginsengisoli TaxID=363837 RepID=A0A2P8FMZ8_9BACT|nr:MFS transporter [Chitinophaga ginsengisoli]PSL23082.1 DHA2 family multidrug resistance protein [Chitinophaga ginsengisoli]
MNAPDFFKPWVQKRKGLIWIGLFLILLSGIVQFGLYALNQNYVVSHFGAQPEDVSLSLQLTYVGILAILPIQFRFLRYFERRSYMLFIIIAGILLSIACLYTTDIFVFMGLRLMIGVVVACIAASVLTLYFSSLPPAKATAIGSTIFYTTILANTVIIGILSAWVTDNYDWPYIYKYLIAFQVFTLLIVLLLLNPGSGMKRYPLYQIDWFGFVAMLSIGISLAYLFIYGPKYYWFTDTRIILSAFVATISIGILYYRQTTLKRPYLDPSVLTSKRFITGILILVVYFGAKDSINLIYGYCATVLRWDTYSIMWLAAFNFSAILISTIIALLMLSRKIPFRVLFILGLTSLAIYHSWMYLTFTPDIAFSDLAWPVFFQGAASGFLFVPVIVYAVSGLPASTGFTGISLAAISRFITGLNSAAGFYTLQLYFNQLNREKFLRHITNVDENFSQRFNQFVQLFRSKGFSVDQANALANTNINRALTVQSQLMTNMYVFKLMFIVSVTVLLLVITGPFINKAFRALVNVKKVPALE